MICLLYIQIIYVQRIYIYTLNIYIYTHTRIVEVGCASYLPCCCWGHPCLAPGRMALVKDWWSMGLDVFEWNVNFFLFIGSKQELWMWFLIVESDGQKRHTAYCFNLFQVFQQQNMVRCFNFRCGSLHDARLAAEVEVWEEELGLWLVDGKMQVSGPGRADHWRLPWWCSCLFLPLPSLCRCFSLSNSIYSYIKGIHTICIHILLWLVDHGLRSMSVVLPQSASQQEKPHDWWDYNAAWLRWQMLVVFQSLENGCRVKSYQILGI